MCLYGLESLCVNIVFETKMDTQLIPHVYLKSFFDANFEREWDTVPLRISRNPLMHETYTILYHWPQLWRSAKSPFQQNNEMNKTQEWLFELNQDTDQRYTLCGELVINTEPPLLKLWIQRYDIEETNLVKALEPYELCSFTKPKTQAMDTNVYEKAEAEDDPLVFDRYLANMSLWSLFKQIVKQKLNKWFYRA